MRHIKPYGDLEEADITVDKKKLFVGDRKVRDMSATELDDNIMYILFKQGTILSPPNTFYVYFVDTTSWADKFKTGEYELLMFPFRRRFDFNAAPITDIWKKSHTKKSPGAEHIMGIIEGVVLDDKKELLIRMMSVRNAFKRNRLNSLMLNALEDKHPGYKLVWEDPTEDGLAFISKYDKDPVFRWTFDFRPKSYKTLFPNPVEK